MCFEISGVRHCISYRVSLYPYLKRAPPHPPEGATDYKKFFTGILQCPLIVGKHTKTYQCWYTKTSFEKNCHVYCLMARTEMYTIQAEFSSSVSLVQRSNVGTNMPMHKYPYTFTWLSWSCSPLKSLLYVTFYRCNSNYHNGWIGGKVNHNMLILWVYIEHLKN